MLEKILDIYFSKKLADKVRREVKIYYADAKSEIKYNCLKVYVKPREYKDKYYKEVLTLEINNSFDVLLNYNIYKDSIIKTLEELLEEL